MNDFEKALEASANEKEENLFKMMIKEGYDRSIAEQQAEYCNLDFQSGACWAREFTVEEICEWIVGNGEFIVRNHCPANLKMAIESHFKDRGGEK